jgi:hypothetical protein
LKKSELSKNGLKSQKLSKWQKTWGNLFLWLQTVEVILNGLYLKDIKGLYIDPLWRTCRAIRISLDIFEISFFMSARQFSSPPACSIQHSSVFPHFSIFSHLFLGLILHTRILVADLASTMCEICTQTWFLGDTCGNCEIHRSTPHSSDDHNRDKQDCDVPNIHFGEHFIPSDLLQEPAHILQQEVLSLRNWWSLSSYQGQSDV